MRERDLFQGGPCGSSTGRFVGGRRFERLIAGGRMERADGMESGGRPEGTLLAKAIEKRRGVDMSRRRVYLSPERVPHPSNSPAPGLWEVCSL